MNGLDEHVRHVDFLHQCSHDTAMSAAPFWKTKRLDEMTHAEWESLCDGCGKCCLSKLEDEDTGEILWTSVVCRLFSKGDCSCSDYANRAVRVPDCVQLTPQNVPAIPWLPKTCAYRLVNEGRDLFDWHPLISGDPGSVRRAGMTVDGVITSFEHELGDDSDYFLHMLEQEP